MAVYQSLEASSKKNMEFELQKIDFFPQECQSNKYSDWMII